MLRIIELVGLIAPLAALAVIIVYRHGVPKRATWLAVIGCLFTGASVAVSFIGEHTIILGAMHGGDIEGIRELAGLITLIRFVVLLLGVLGLAVAAVSNRRDSRSPIGWLTGGIGLVLVGVIVGVVISAVENATGHSGDEGIAVVVTILGEAVEFAALGLGTLALSIAVVTRRSGADENRRDPAELAMGAARTAWTAYRSRR